MRLLNAMKLTRDTAVVARYSQAHLNRPENVLEHTGFVCVMCMLIGLDHGDVDMGELMIKATVHDLEESKIGDIANPVKYANPQILKELKKIGKKAMSDISNETGIYALYDYWESSKDDSIEGKIVKLADVLAVLAKIHEEVVLYSNTSFLDYANNTLKFFREQLAIETDPVLIDLLKEAIYINKELLS